MSDLLIPEGSLLLHLGPPKTGSTAIQRAMNDAREELAQHGVHYPGPFRPAPAFRPAEAGRAVMGANASVGRHAPRIRLWHDLLDDLAASTLPRTCLSNEDFARCDDVSADRIVRDLGVDRVHVVYWARRIDRLLPSHWQERVKAQLTWTYHDYVRRLIAGDQTQGESSLMWTGHDVRDVVERWSRLIGHERVTVVVADESDHDLLPRTFGAMLGVPPELLRPPDGANRSLTLSQAEAVRRVNAVFAEHGWSGVEYWRVVQLGIARTLKAADRSEGDRLPGLPPDVLDAVHDRSDAQAAAIGELGELGVRVVGDPETLRTRGRVVADDSPDTVDAVSLDVLGQVVDGALQGAFDLQRRRVARASRGRRAAPDTLATAPASALARELGRRARARIRRH